MIQWLKNRMLGLAMATSKVEKNALNNYGNNLTDDAGVHHTQKKDSVAQDLINGEVTKEVENLRWRYYKVLQESEKFDKMRRWDPKTGAYEIFENADQAIKTRLRNVKADPYDDYELNYVIMNTESMNGIASRLGAESNFKWKLEFEYNNIGRFKIEDFCKQVYMKDMGNGDKICAMYFHKYHDGYNPIHSLFIKELERSYKTKTFNTIFDIKKIGWITDKADLGVYDNRGFLYYIKGYNGIVEHNGSYIVKFVVSPEFEDFNIFEKYRVDELDEKYKNRDKRSNTLG